MKMLKINDNVPEASAIGLGCMRITGLDGSKAVRELVEASIILKKAGKVRAFGVSNHNPMQIELLNSCLAEPLCVNQIQYSVAHCPTIDAGLNVNICNDSGCSRAGSVIEYCRLKKMTIQA